ncbi:MAG TPA: CpsB/CapC family capsule biosynthesis tyrosine phosphatase, partial [Dehalococcoidia bacterium]|nr:CpsB/CapC family capsule biosynthesis tyrosine phosphatase [Dehalococcoidia bacterium]
QLTAASLLGVFGKKTREASEAFLLQGLVQVLATDSHSSSGGRKPVLSEAVAAAARLVGEERAQGLVLATPERILKGETLEVEVPVAARSRRWAFWK